MALTTTDFNVSFLLGGSSKVFKFTDVTDYTSQGESLNDVTGRIKITAPSGVVYNNLAGSADITGSTSRINTTTIQVPLLSDGTPEVGLYTFEYQSTIGAVVVSKIKTFSYSYKKPTPSNQATVDCLSPQLSGSDTTNYLVNSLTPSDRFSITSVSAANNTISIAGEKVGFVTVGDTFSIINSSGNDGDYTVISVEYDKATDTTVISVASITNSTIDGTVVTRKTTLFYPSVLQLTPLVGTEKTLSTNSFYSQTHEFLFKTKGYYQYTNGISISDSFSSSKEIDVDCDIRLCDIFCCINSLFNDYIKYKEANNTTLAAIELERYVLATSHLASLRTAFECGDTVAVDNLVTQIKKVAQCNSDCSCSDGDPAPITGLGSGTTTVVSTSGNGIQVASNVSGTETTYTLSLSQSILDDITNATATSSVVSSDSSLVVTSSVVGSNTEYNVTLPPSTPIIEPKEMMAFDVDINLTSGFAYTISNSTIQNPTNLQSSVVFTDVDSAAPANYWYRLKIDGFQSSFNTTYKAFVSFTFASTSGSPGVDSNNVSGLFSRYLNPTIVKKESGEFYIIFLGVGGYPVSRLGMSQYSNIKLNIKIIE